MEHTGYFIHANINHKVRRIMPNLNKQRIELLKETMENDLANMTRAMHQAMNPQLKTNYADMNGEVADANEEAMADAYIDVDNTIIELHAQKINDLNAALNRMDAGEYGTCIDCNEAINYSRLLAYPTAKRCLACQTLREKNK
jgi:DnaK suppressor protein